MTLWPDMANYSSDIRGIFQWANAVTNDTFSLGILVSTMLFFFITEKMMGFGNADCFRGAMSITFIVAIVFMWLGILSPTIFILVLLLTGISYFPK